MPTARTTHRVAKAKSLYFDGIKEVAHMNAPAIPLILDNRYTKMVKSCPKVTAAKNTAVPNINRLQWRDPTLHRFFNLTHRQLDKMDKRPWLFVHKDTLCWQIQFNETQQEILQMVFGALVNNTSLYIDSNRPWLLNTWWARLCIDLEEYYAMHFTLKEGSGECAKLVLLALPISASPPALYPEHKAPVVM